MTEFSHRPFSSLTISVRLTQIVRSSVDPSGAPALFNVTAQGVEGSPRRPQDGFVTVGRQQINEFGQRPNDIMLPASDRAISRCHCRLNYQNCFRERRLSDQFVAFLMAGHSRLGANSEFSALPQHLFYYIYTFFKEPYALWLSDLGSICGTYLKVNYELPTEIHRGMVFLIGSDIIIDIDDVTTSGSATVSDPTLLQTMIDVSEHPQLRLTIGRIPDSEDSTVHKHTQAFVAEKPGHTFLIGRSNACDVKLNDSTISRTQCRVMFTGDKWIMLDGIDRKPSVNGTWLSVCKKDRNPREESPPVALLPGAQIKISETVLQVSWDF